MRKKSTATILGFLGLAFFATFVYWFEHRTRNEGLQRIEQHSQAVEPALWNLDASLVADYFNLATVSYGYETLSVHRAEGPLFLESRGPELEGAERWLDQFGLLPRITLTAPVIHDGTVIGLVRAVYISRSIYVEAYAMLAIILLVVLVERSLRVAEGQRTLELRVIERTRQLAESEANHRQLTRLLDLAPDVVFVREAEGKISYWNKGAEHLFGPGGRDVIEARLQFVYTSAVDADQNGGLRSAGLWVGEFASTHPNGREVTLHASLSLTPNERGQSRVLFIAPDITDRLQLESHLLRVQRTEAVGTLASGIAHDFNNLLTPILLSTQLLRAGAGVSAPSRSPLETIEKCARRGADLVQQLMNLSGSRPSQRSTVYLPVILRDILQLLKSTFPKSIQFEHEWPTELPPLDADPTNIHQAILNLCLNARDSMPDGGKLRLEAAAVTLDPAQLERHPTAAPDNWIRLAVSDSGRGIPPEIQDRIFDPFFTTKETGKGTGLGLATVQGIVRSHGGFVELASELGQGSTFTLFFPGGVFKKPTPAITTTAAVPRGAAELIMIVDDELSVRLTTARLLERFGYRVLIAESGKAALDLQAAYPGAIQAVITDLMMPGMDGVELATALRAKEPALPIAVTTGLLNSANRTRINAAGITVVLSKPYDAEELLGVVHRLVHSGG